MRVGNEGSRREAFTILELFVVIVIIGILATLLIPVISTMRARAQRAQCTANLKSLYVATELFIQRNGSWPQIRLAGNDDAAMQTYARAWIEALAPFGISQKIWVCPTVQDLMHNPDLTKPENVRVDYMATSFDSKPTTPHQWPRQPWFAEIGDVHGHGNLIIFTDGSVSDLKTVAGKN